MMPQGQAGTCSWLGAQPGDAWAAGAERHLHKDLTEQSAKYLSSPLNQLLIDIHTNIFTLLCTAFSFLWALQK